MQAAATATGSGIWPSLVFIMGEERRSFVLQSPAFSIGRKADKDLTLLNPRVSRDHAMIVREAMAISSRTRTASTVPTSTASGW